MATASGRLRVEFRWQHDRFVHQIVVRDDGRVASVEGSSDDPWPPSPPLQQLSLEQINGSNVILGVGAAGQSHWSVSVESSDQQGEEKLKFDVACRCRTAPRWLGNTYQHSRLLHLHPLAQSELHRDDADRIAIGPANGGGSEPGTRRWSFLVALVQSPCGHSYPNGQQ